MDMKKDDDASFDLADYASLDAILALENSPKVTAQSFWKNDVWRLPGSVPGVLSANFVIRFDVDADRKVIDGLKWLTALLFIGRYGQITYHPSTAGAYSAGIRHLARFMKQRNYRTFGKLDRSAFDDFVTDIHVSLVDPKEEAQSTLEEAESPFGDEAFEGLLVADGVEPIDRAHDDPDAMGGVAKAYNKLRIWKLLWDHRHVMAEAGIKSPLAFNPFSKSSPTTMARTLATIAAEEIPSLPDEVALPVLAGALRILGQPANDVQTLQSRYLALMQRMDREPPTDERIKIRRMMESFEFSKIKGEARRWHPPIVLTDAGAGGGEHLRDLIELVRNACLIVIMGFTGVRISEAVSIVVEPRLLIDDELPTCVTKETSKSGLSDHYILHGLLSKAQGKPTPEEWLMGSRPRSGGAEPPTVRAVRVLEKLYAPWRRFASETDVSQQLFIGFLGSGLPRRRSSVAKISSQTLRFGMKTFVGDSSYVDLSGLAKAAETKNEIKPYLPTDKLAAGACIRPHQWRKNFMRYAMRTDNRMAPAVSQHFKHFTVALTERDYGAKDIRFLEEGDSVRARETGSFLRRMVEGHARPVTRLDRAFANVADQWRKLVPEGSQPDDAGFTKVALDQDLRIWFAEHGRCLIALQPGEARCHERAGTGGWRHARPNHLTRTPSLCAGCSNFSIHEDTAAFWRRRYVENQTAYLQSKGELSFEVIRRVAEQAANYLRALGEELPVINLGEVA